VDVLKVNEETCTKCGACAEVCHIAIISFQDNGYPQITPEKEVSCSKCGACLIVCPSDSLVLQDIPLEQCPPIDPTLTVSFDRCVQLIKTRRSIRAFKDEPVSREVITRLLDVARYSPTAANIQNTRWIVFDNKDEVEQLRKIGADFLIQMLEKNPAFPSLAELIKKGERDGVILGAPVVVATYGPKEMPAGPMISYIALAYLNLAADSLGLGCCWNGFFTAAANNFPPMIKAIGLPEGQQLHGSLALGYPKYKYHRIPMRNPANVTWHS